MKVGDTQPANPVTASAASNPKVMQAAHDFEAMAIGQMLEPMFDTADMSGDLFGGGAGESNFRPMLVSEMAKEMEKHGGIGLGDTIYEQMLRLQEKKR